MIKKKKKKGHCAEDLGDTLGRNGKMEDAYRLMGHVDVMNHD